MLTENFKNVLAVLKEQDLLQKEIENLDTATSEGATRRDVIQCEMTTLYGVLNRFTKEYGKVLALFANDGTLTIDSATEEWLERVIAT